MTNRLAQESSPYLQQHATNPVDWYPWGDEALARAKAEDKPIFLSIGYAACHWCHVMEHETFEDAATAALMNDLFVNIKVDREERPDLDGIYMQAVMAMTGQGGWPMSVWLTPEGMPFYGGTYYPPTPRHGLPSFEQVSTSIGKAWKTQRGQIDESIERFRQFLQHDVVLAAEPDTGDKSESILKALEQGFDDRHGGWGSAPKFPQPMALEFLVRHQLGDDVGSSRTMADRTLQAMARGGIYDQLGGGFHRYSTDSRWLVPHFEKMLYDNAQLARVYLHAWQKSKREDYRRIVHEVLDYVMREMTDPDGGFYSTQDADSEGTEGKFFVWSDSEVRALLGDDADLFAEVYGVFQGGNWEGQTILNMAQEPSAVAQRHGLSPDDLERRLARARATLFEAREDRVKPARDDKVVTAWNGLMLATFAEAARALGHAPYLAAARANAAFLLDNLWRDDARLFRTWKAGHGAKLNGYLEDYSHVIEGLLALYQTTFEPRWFEAALQLAHSMVAHFAHPAGGFFDTSDDHETLITRPRDLHDNAVPSGNAMAATVLLKLAALTGDSAFRTRAEQAVGAMAEAIGQHPIALGQWLTAYDLMRQGPVEIALVGNPEGDDFRALSEIVNSRFLPNAVVAAGESGKPSRVPLVEGRGPVDGRATAYVCRRFVCERPVTDPRELEQRLLAASPI